MAITICYKILCRTGLITDKETVRLISKALDPVAFEKRKSKKLKRGLYHWNGPNNIWNIEECDKLKTYGMAIYVDINGFSRKILWLKLGVSINKEV